MRFGFRVVNVPCIDEILEAKLAFDLEAPDFHVVDILGDQLGLPHVVAVSAEMLVSPEVVFGRVRTTRTPCSLSDAAGGQLQGCRWPRGCCEPLRSGGDRLILRGIEVLGGGQRKFGRLSIRECPARSGLPLSRHCAQCGEVSH